MGTAEQIKPTLDMETVLVPGKYQLTESENFDNFMGALGVGYLVRKLGNRSKPLVTLSQEGKEWTMKSESLVKTTETTFEMDKQFEEVTADGRKVLTTMKVTAPNTSTRRCWEPAVARTASAPGSS